MENANGSFVKRGILLDVMNMSSTVRNSTELERSRSRVINAIRYVNVIRSARVCVSDVNDVNPLDRASSI